MDNTLRKALWGVLRPLVQLLTNLLSPEKGEEWEREFKRFLRKEPCWVKPTFELYLAPGQQNDGTMKVFDLEKHLQETKLIDRCLGLEDELVKGWLANPSSYPEEFKRKTVFLWKSKLIFSDSAGVAYLYWDDDLVIVDWSWPRDWWDGSRPALLKPAA